MEQSSSYTFLAKARKKKARIVEKLKFEQEEEQKVQCFDCSSSEDEIDTNVVEIDLGILKDTKNIQMGDPIKCQGCEAILNKFSKIVEPKIYLNKQKQLSLIVEEKEDQEEKKEEKKEEEEEEEEKENKDDKKQENQSQKINWGQVRDSDKIWECEFCGNINIISIEEEEIPQQGDVIYIVESQNQQQDKKQDNSDFSIVFCLDNSGSMSVTHEVKGKKINLKHGLTDEEYNMLKQFIDAGDEHQYMPGQNQNTTYISRKQCVLAAIESQLNQMKIENPDRKIGVVTFSDDVVIIGDGHQKEPVVITGDKLYSEEQIQQISLANADKQLSHTIKDSIQQLTDKFSKIEEKGKTALGPALLSSIQLASKGKPGSMVVICTDGLANIGLGAMDTDENIDASKEFYNKLSQTAKDLGIIISVITIKGEGCKIEILGQLVDQTNGQVTRVDPGEIDKDFAEILKDEIVGTKVQLDVQLHQALEFRKQDKKLISQDGSYFQKNIGNATVSSIEMFEYQVKTDEILQEKKVDIQNLSEIPLQARITYNTVQGDKYQRIVTQVYKTTQDRQQAEGQVKLEIINKRITQNSAQLMSEGKFQKAKKYNKQWTNYVMENEAFDGIEENRLQKINFKNENKRLKKTSNRIYTKNFQPSQQRSQTTQSFQPQKLSIQKQEKEEKGFFSKVKDMFSSKEKSEGLQQESMKRSSNIKKAPKKKLSIQKDDDQLFSCSEGEYSSEEDDKDEIMMINMKQQKKKK